MKSATKPAPPRLSTLLLVLAIGPLLVLMAGVPGFSPRKARMARAQAEINNIELSLTAMLADAGKTDFFSLFNDVEALREAHGSYQNAWNAVIPDLLRRGSSADVDLKPEVRQSLGKNYMELGNDPWGSPYQFFVGPLTKEVYRTPAAKYYLRSYRPASSLPYTDCCGRPQTDYHYDAKAKKEADAETPGAPPADGFLGYPAPPNMTVYIWSTGKDGRSCQRVGVNLSPENVNVGPSSDSGDDIVSWDELECWQMFYN